MFNNDENTNRSTEDINNTPENRTSEENTSQEQTAQQPQQNQSGDEQKIVLPQGGYSYASSNVFRTPPYTPAPEPPKPPKKKKSSVTKSFIAIAVCLCIIASGAAGFGGTYLANRLTAQSQGGTVNGTQTTIGGSNGSVIYKSVASGDSGEILSEDAVENAARLVENTVVEIQTETVQTNSFYGQYVTEGAGSGVIITADGYIITCAHVIDGSDTVNVTMKDGTKFVAQVIGSDSVTDIAILKVNATNLPYAVIGDSDAIVVGRRVIAVGNPLGELGGTVTDGIISALDRNVQIDNRSYNLLQTNAAINPGNSGGGLFNLNGELIGVVNAKSAGSEIEGLGFAIPINDAIDIADQLMQYGYIKGRPKLGITAFNFTSSSNIRGLGNQEYAAILNYLSSYGVYFIEYNENQTEGDLKFGDRIVAIDGITISDQTSLESILNEDYEIGDTVKLTIARITDLTSRNPRSEMIDVEITLVETLPVTTEN